MDINEMFPARYCGGRHLPATGVLVEIQTVKPEKMRAGQGKPEETKYVLFGKRIAGGQIVGVQNSAGLFGFVLRKKLAEQIAFITGSRETDDWHGKRVVFFACESKAAGEIVMSVCARPPRPATDKASDKPVEKAPESAPESAPATDHEAGADDKQPDPQAAVEPAQEPPASSPQGDSQKDKGKKASAWRLIDYRTHAEQWIRDSDYPARDEMKRHYAKLIGHNVSKGTPVKDAPAWSDEWINPTIAHHIKNLADALMNALQTTTTPASGK